MSSGIVGRVVGARGLRDSLRGRGLGVVVESVGGFRVTPVVHVVVAVVPRCRQLRPLPLRPLASVLAIVVGLRVPESPVELLSTEELRAGLAQRLGSVGLPPGRLYGGPRPKQVVRPSAPLPVGRIIPGPKAKPKPKPNPFEHINLPPRPVRPWWHS